MAYVFSDDRMGLRNIGSVSDGPRSPAVPGMLAHAVDPVLGGAELIWMQGAANTAIGSLVTYNQLAGTTTLAADGVHAAQPVAVATAAIGPGQYGWYVVSGNALIAKTAGSAIAAGGQVGVSATPGQVASSAGGAGSLSNAFVNAPALAADPTVNVQISRPMVN